MEKLQGCLEKFSWGGSEGNQTVQSGPAPKDSWITRGTFLGNKFPDKSKAFPLLVILWGLTTEEDAAEGLPEGNPE